MTIGSPGQRDILQSLIAFARDKEREAVKEATDTILPVWVDAFKSLLIIPVERDVQSSTTWDTLAIRMEIFKVVMVYLL